MKTAFRDVKTEILNRIVSGEWGPGDLLPNEVQLAEDFACARATVNRAMRELADEGIVERKRKAGTRVRKSPMRHARFSIPVVREEIETRGLMYRYALVGREVVSTPDWVRARFGLAQAGQVLHLTCLHSADGNPYQFEDRWINLDALPQAKAADFTEIGPNEWLLATVPYSNVEISFSATSASEETARNLGCAQGDALFLAERSTWFEGKPVTYVRLTFQRGYRMATRY